MWAASKGHLDALETDKIVDFEKDFIDVMRTKGKDWMKRINKNKVMDDKDREKSTVSESISLKRRTFFKIFYKDLHYFKYFLFYKKKYER